MGQVIMWMVRLKQTQCFVKTLNLKTFLVKTEDHNDRNWSFLDQVSSILLETDIAECTWYAPWMWQTIIYL